MDPQRTQRRQPADQEHRAPAEPREDDRREQRRSAVADRPRALHEADGLAAMPVGPAFGHERRACRPRPAHAEAEQEPEDRQLPHTLRQAAGRGEQRVHEDTGDDAGPAPSTIGQRAEHDAAERGRGERQRSERAAERLRHAELGDHRRQHHRIDHDVEAVEQPAERGCDERALRRGRRHAQPAERPRLESQQPGVERSGSHGHAVSCRARASLVRTR